MLKILGYIILGLIGLFVFSLPFIQAINDKMPWWYGFVVWGLIAVLVGLMRLGLYLIQFEGD